MCPNHTERPDRAPAPDTRASATNRSRGGGGGGVRDQLRTMNYADGAAAVSPEGSQGPTVGDGGPSIPAGLPQNQQEIQESVDHASISGTATKGQLLGERSGVAIRMAAGTRMNASMGHGNMRISAHPGLQVEIPWWPDAELDGLRYNFRSGEFEADAEGVGPDAAYEAAISWIANNYFKPKLPTAMRKKGYEPQNDPDLMGTFKALGSVFGVDASEAKGDKESPVKDVRTALEFHLEEGMEIPVAGGTVMMKIPPHARFQLAAALAGDPKDTKIDRITLRSLGRPIEVGKTEGFAKELQGLELNALHILPGGKVELDYDLILENMTEGVMALFAVFAAAAGEPRALNARIPKARYEGLRAIVNEKVAAAAEPQLAAMLRTYDDAIPGVSLVQAFGL